MADKSETMMDKIADKIHSHDESSSDSGDEKRKSSDSASKTNIYRLFGEANLFLWRNKTATAAGLGGATAIWVLIKLMAYHFLPLVCHSLIQILTVLFIWFNAATLFKKSPPHIPDVSIPEDLAVKIALSLRLKINGSLAALREIALSRDLKKFLAVIAGLWAISIVGSLFDFLTLVYLVFVLMHAVPLAYEKYEDTADAFVEKAMREIKKQYAAFDANFMSKIPGGPLKDKKS